MADIFELHAKAFASVSAYIVLKGNERVATIAFKFPKDGAGRLYAYVHFLGSPMVRGQASGYGYDKRSAAVANAVNSKAFSEGLKKFADAVADGRSIWETERAGMDAFRAVLAVDGGEHWDTRLHKAGYTVMQAV